MQSSKVAAGLSKGALGVAGFLALAISAQAQVASVVDDFEGGAAQNKFLGYTFFYSDIADGGNSVVASATATTPTTLAFDPLKSIDSVGGGANGSKKSLKLDFTFGTTQPTSAGCMCKYGNMVGVGTQLVPGTDPPGGAVLDLSSAATGSISFWAKAAAPTNVRVELATKNVDDFGFYRYAAALTTTWTKFSFTLTADALTGLSRPVWATKVIPLDLTQAQKLQFQVSVEDNALMTVGTVWLDDIKVEGYSWVPPAACMSCIGAQGAGTGLLLSDLEPAETGVIGGGTQNKVGGFWYAYNDVGTRAVTAPSQYSSIFEGIVTPSVDPLVPILVASPAKGAAASAGAYIRYELGPTYTDNGNVVQPFVGLGTRVSNNLGTSFLNATGSTGISFDYWTDTSSALGYIQLECKANQVLSATNAAVVHYVLLPATAGVWKSATVPWTSLVLPDWAESPPLALNPLKVAELEKFQWAVKASPGLKGAIAVDNVKIIGMTAFPALGIVNHGSKSARGLRMSQISGGMLVDYALPAGVDGAVINVIDLSGAVVASRSVSGKGSLQATMGTQGLRSGLYTMQVKHSKGSENASFTVMH